jgi:hypothetical protein
MDWMFGALGTAYLGIRTRLNWDMSDPKSFWFLGFVIVDKGAEGPGQTGVKQWQYDCQ